MKYNKSNIITDKDIIFTTSKDNVSTLGETLENQQSQIDELRSNIKWMYKYGALGSGAGGGSGSGTSTSFKVLIYKGENELIKSGSTLYYSSTGNYPIKIQILNGGTSAYKISFSWDGDKTSTNTITSADGFMIIKNLAFSKNSTLNITVTNLDTMEVYNESGSPVLSFNYVVEAYSFKSYYVYGNDPNTTESLETYTPINNSIYMSQIKTSGIMLALEYVIAVDINKDASFIKYNDFEGNTYNIIGENTKIKKGSGKIYLPLAQNIIEYLSNNNNASYKQIDIEASITLESNINPEPSYKNSFKDNLIPNGLYLKINTTGGVMVQYDSAKDMYESTSNIELENRFIPGDIVFNLTPYYDYQDKTRIYYTNIKMYDVDDEGNVESEPSYETKNIQLVDQEYSGVIVQCAEGGIKKLIFTLTLGNEFVSYEYWINVRIFESNFNWYPDNISPISHAYYRNGLISENIENLSKNELLEFNINSSIKTLNFSTTHDTKGGDISEYNGLIDILDIMENIGIQYSQTNDFSKPILSINTDDSTSTEIGADSIFIYQDKIVITSGKSQIRNNNVNVGTVREETEIFIPLCDILNRTNKDNYHLLSLYKRFENHEGNNYWKALYAYIDGCLDGICANFLPINKIYNSITLYPGNYIINTFDITYWDHNPANESKLYLNDNDVALFWYTYNIRMKATGVNTYDNDAIFLYNTILTDFEEDEENYVHYKNDSTPSNIAQHINVPVMVLYFDDVNGNIGGGFSGRGKDNFKDFINTQFEEEQTGIPEKIPVYVEYSPGKSELQQITLPNGDLANFLVSLQGSSTRSFRCKNFELYAPKHNNQDNFVYVYSPNNDPDPTNTKAFLPEESLTLKADVVDSSHTNNNAIGAFVDENTEQFADASFGQRSIYIDRLKNCLTGFPVLLFLHTKYYGDDSKLEVFENRFFLGIYNFNLGRGSAFNMGYKRMNALDDIIANSEKGFKIFEISTNDNEILSNVEVAEIQGNEAHFDFSQYDPSVLFKIDAINDKTYMWGDFVHNPQVINANMLKDNIARFCERIAYSGGYLFKRINKIFSDSPNNRYGYSDKYSATDAYGNPLEQVPNFRYQYKRIINESGQLVTRYDDTGEQDMNNLLRNIINSVFEYINDDGRNIPIIDFRSLAEYYVICMAFALTDSVQKNLNIKSWNSEENKKWYTAFYDMDTGLGNNNAGNKIKFFAFSDYWQSEITKDNNNKNVLSAVKIYRDWAPMLSTEASSFFDVPSSYLFAIAKYAYNVLKIDVQGSSDIGAALAEMERNDPSNIWGSWRKANGCLKNAESFMQRYFDHHLAGIPEIIFNLNYRYKYMLKDNVNSPKAYKGEEFGKFHGRKNAYVRYWLDGRIHILDGYFNVSQFNDMITSEIQAPRVTHNEYKPTDNEDVYILREIFSDGLVGNQYSENSKGELMISARPFTPIHIKVANSDTRYLFPETTEPCKIYIGINGLQTILCGGSPQWTYCESINQFITANNTFRVKSKYLTDIVGNTNECRQWSIDSLALKNLSLTSPDYKGTLKIMPSEDNNFNQYVNLTEVNISNSNINLEMNNVPVRIIKAKNKPGGDLILTNLNKLEDLQIDGKFNRLTLGSWKQNCSLPSNQALQLSCEEISITNDLDRFPHNSITIANNPILEKVTITQFDDVTITNCPNIKEIILDKCNNLERLVINMPQNKNKNVVLNLNNNEVDGIIDLSSYKHLKTVSFTNCSITKVIFPANCDIDLPTNAFSQVSMLESIETGENTKLYLTGANVFQNCSKLIYTDIPIHVKMGVTSLAYTFSCYGTDRGKMTYEDVKAFFERIEDDIQDVTLGNGRVVKRPPTMYVTSIKDMFRNQNIEYSKELGIQEYNEQKCSIKLSMFLRCFSLDDALSNNNISFLNRYMLCETNENGETYRLGHTLVDDYGNKVRKIMYVNNFSNIYTTIDLLNDVIEDCIGINCQSTTLNFVDNTGLELSEIKINDFFTAQNTKTNYITLINYFNIDNVAIYEDHNSSVIFDFSELFNSPKYDKSTNNITSEYGDKWSAASTGIQLYKFMDGSYRVDSLNNINYLLSNCKLRDNIYSSFGSFIPINNVTEYNALDIYTFINWNNIDNIKSLFHTPQVYNGQIHGTSDGLNMKKFVTYEHMHKIIESLLNTTNLEYVGGLFNNCTVIVDNVENEFTFIDREKYDLINNTTLKSISGLFGNMTISMGGINENHPIIIHQDLMKPFKNVISFVKTFENWYFKYPLPFDFFNKRYETSEVMNNYCGRIENDERIGTNVIKYEYKYNSDIIDIQECFKNVKFDKARAFKLDGIYDGYDIFGEIEKPKRNRFTYVENGEIKVTDHVYSPNGSQIDIDPSYELIDAEEAETTGYSIENYSVDSEYILSGQNTGNIILIGASNQYIRNIPAQYIDASGCFISPDFLYGMSKAGYFQDSIARTTSFVNTPYYTFTGTIPKHFMKNLMTARFTGLFTGLNITPIHMPEFDVLDPEEETQYYVFVPEGFSDSDDFSGAFNFNMLFPRHDQGYIEFFALMTDKSLPNMQKLSDATFNIRYDIEGNILGGSQSLADVHLNDSYLRYNLMISHDDNNIYYGIDSNKFPYMRYDFIINSWQAFIYYGNLILNDDGGWNTNKLYNKGSFLYNMTALESQFANILKISKNMLFNAKSDNNQYFNLNSSLLTYINKQSLINCSDPTQWEEAYGDKFIIVS